MTNDNYRLETDLRSATDDLSSSIGSPELPPFKPTRRKAPAALLAMVLVVGGGTFLGLRDDGVQTIRTPVAEEGELQESIEVPEPDDAVVRTPNDSEGPSAAVFGKDATPPVSGNDDPVELLEWSTDPVYGTPVRQLTSAEDTRFDVLSSPNRQPENADATLVLSYHGTDGYRIIDRETGAVASEVALTLLSEPRWHATDPAVVRHLADPDSEDALLRLYETNVVTGERSIVADPSGRLRNNEFEGIRWPTVDRMSTREQGIPSADDSLWAWVVDDTDGDPLGVFTYDISTDQLVGRMELRTDAGDIDYVSVSPSGKYVVVAYDQGSFIYNRELRDERRLTVGNDPGDFAIAADGSDAFVVMNFAPDDDSGWLLSIDLATLERIRIFDVFEAGNTSINVSGQAFDKPGWAVVSTFNCRVDSAWTCNKVMAVEMIADGRIVNLAHTYSCAESFWTEPIATPSRDLTRVYFNSDSGSCNEDGEVFQLQAPPFD